MVNRQHLRGDTRSQVGRQAAHDSMQEFLFEHIDGAHLRAGGLSGLAEIEWDHLRARRRLRTGGSGGWDGMDFWLRQFLFHISLRPKNRRGWCAATWPPR